MQTSQIRVVKKMIIKTKTKIVQVEHATQRKLHTIITIKNTILYHFVQNQKNSFGFSNLYASD